MSRIGHKPIEIPEGVAVEISSSNRVKVQGPRGVLIQDVSKAIQVQVEDKAILVGSSSKEKESKALHGLYRMLIYNMVVGVTKGYRKSLEIVGLGYKASVDQRLLELSLGKSHVICLLLPKEINVQVENTKGKNPRVYIHVEGIDKQLVGQIAAKIRGEKPPEAYITKRSQAQKGIRYIGEVLIGKSKKDGK